MIDYRTDSLKFLHNVMRGRCKESQAIIDKENATVEVVKIPVSIEGRMKAAERILKYYENGDMTEERSEEYGILILPEVRLNDAINSQTKSCD